jgi:hypothetical protein
MAARQRPLPQRQSVPRNIVGAVANAARVAAPIVAVAVIAVLLHRQYVNDEFTIETFESVRRLHNRRNRERTALQQTLTDCLHVTKLYSQVLHKVAITAGRDALQSTQSCGTLLYWLLRPIVLLGGLVLQWAMLGTYVLLYEYILVRGLLSPQAIQHVKKVFWNLVRWQQSLTPRQKAAECLAVISIIFIHKLVKFLQRRRYLRTLQGWIHRRRYALNRVRMLRCFEHVRSADLRYLRIRTLVTPFICYL